MSFAGTAFGETAIGSGDFCSGGTSTGRAGLDPNQVDGENIDLATGATAGWVAAVLLIDGSVAGAGACTGADAGGASGTARGAAGNAVISVGGFFLKKLNIKYFSTL